MRFRQLRRLGAEIPRLFVRMFAPGAVRLTITTAARARQPPRQLQTGDVASLWGYPQGIENTRGVKQFFPPVNTSAAHIDYSRFFLFSISLPKSTIVDFQCSNKNNHFFF